MKIEISAKLELEDDDLLRIRTMLSKAVANAVYNSVRKLVEDGFLPDYNAIETGAEPEPEPEPEPVFGRYMEREPDPLPAPRREQKPTKERVSVLQILGPPVHVQPPGYITTEAGADILGGSDSDKAQLGGWIRTKQVKAVIVKDGKSPVTRGCDGGRLMVERASVVQRNQLRLENAGLPVRDRRQFNGASSHAV